MDSIRKKDGHGPSPSQAVKSEPVWVQCNGYRCLAVKDEVGNWRKYHNRSPLPDVVRVLGQSPER